MKIGFLYAGQGSQHCGMGREFYETSSTFRAVFDNAPVDFDLKEMCFGEDEATLSQTHITQPCMTAFAIGVTELLKEHGIVPEMAAGLSLGEYGALYAAGVLDAQTVIALTAYRGKMMTQAAQGIDCGMIAVLGTDREVLRTWCAEVADIGVAEVANCNCPGQIVISGDSKGVSAVGEKAKESGARCIALKVSGPFHTTFMKPAGDALAQRFAQTQFAPMQLPVAFNSTGSTLAEGETIAQLLEKQVQSTVYFEDCVRTMIDAGVDTFIEIGPGKVLSGFMKRIDRKMPIYAIENPADLAEVVGKLKGADV